MFEAVFVIVEYEKQIAELATADPRVQNATAIAALGFVTRSLTCGANAIPTIAATGTKLQINSSDKAVGNSKWTKTQTSSKQTPENRTTRMF